MEAPDSSADPYGSAKPSKFRMKSKSSSKRHRNDDDNDDRHHRDPHKRYRSDYDDDDRHRSHRDSKRRHKHRSRRDDDYKHTTSMHGGYVDPEHEHRESLYDSLNAGNPVNDEEVFRESLFDAMADDEGAAYWEGVYGQPVHVYPNTKTGPDGKLERMTDEEYVDYVRTKMWEKTHQHVLEERAARERARKNAKSQRERLEEEAARQEEEDERIRRRMQESLRKGEERRRAKEVQAAWARYVERWDELKQRKDLGQEGTDARALIPWPVVSGKWKHAWKDDIDHFFEHSPAWTEDPAAMLKVERVRWHPDKMQQRFGQHIDTETMKSVTAVFQVIDRLWEKHGKPR